MAKVMRWCNRHINATAWLVYFIAFSVISNLAWRYPFPPNIAYILVLFGIGVWVLRRKSRSLKNLWWGLVFVMGALYSISQQGHIPANRLAEYSGEVMGTYAWSLIIWTCLKNRTVTSGSLPGKL